MNKNLLRLRGVLALGIAGGIHWALSFAAISIFIGVIDPPSIDPGEGPIGFGTIGAVVGFVSGIAFGAVMALAEAGKPVIGISLGRVAIWGILASAVFPLLTDRANQVVVMGPIGVVFAVALMMIARKAERRTENSPGRLRGMLSAVVLQSVRDTINRPKVSL